VLIMVLWEKKFVITNTMLVLLSVNGFIEYLKRIVTVK